MRNPTAYLTCPIPLNVGISRGNFTVRRYNSQNQDFTRSCGGASQCSVGPSPVVYKVNEKSYYTDTHHAWRCHPYSRNYARNHYFNKPDYSLPHTRIKCCPPPQCTEYQGYGSWLHRQSHALPKKVPEPLEPEPVPPFWKCSQNCDYLYPEKKKRFRFLDCGPLQPGWGCDTGQAHHVEVGYPCWDQGTPTTTTTQKETSGGDIGKGYNRKRSLFRPLEQVPAIPMVFDPKFLEELMNEQEEKRLEKEKLRKKNKRKHKHHRHHHHRHSSEANTASEGARPSQDDNYERQEDQDDV